jgi:multiple sugar transport system permease protein
LYKYFCAIFFGKRRGVSNSSALPGAKVSSRDKDEHIQTLSDMRRKETLVAYLFLAPTLLGFVIFVAGPLLYSVGLSFFEWNVFSPAKFTGLSNYQRLLTDDRLLTSFRNTVLFVVIVVTLDVVVALALAVALQSRMPAALRYFFRTAFILPVVTSVAAIAIILGFMLNTNLGIVNYYLGQIGIPKIAWLSSTQWALISIALATVWKTFGFDLLLLIAGIQNIPRHYYEAANIDGANAWQKFRYITLPQLSPTLFFIVVVGIISHSQVFDQAQIMTAGGPGDATTTVVMVIWDQLSSLRFGYGSTIATILLAVVLTLTILQFRISRRWVYYEGGAE